MKLPLLVEFLPSLDAYGPLVYLPEGDWLIKSDHTSSKLVVETQSTTLPLVEGLTIIGPAQLKVRFIAKGTERGINTYAHKL